MIILNNCFNVPCNCLVGVVSQKGNWQQTAACIAAVAALLLSGMGVMYGASFVAKVGMASFALSAAGLIFPRQKVEIKTATLTAEAFVQHAISLQGKGTYLREPFDSDNILCHNYPLDPPVLFCEFMVLFADWSKVESGELKLFKKIAGDNYNKGRLAMNCWQFILLAMYEKGAITVNDIENLYLHQKVQKLKTWVSLWEPFSRQGSPEIGDIALFYSSGIAHAAIVTSTEPLAVIEMFGSPAKVRPINNAGSLFDRTAYVPLDRAIKVIKELERIEYNSSIHGQLTWNKEEMTCCLRRQIFESQIDKELNRRYQAWRKGQKDTDKKKLASLKSQFHDENREVVARDILAKHHIFS